MDTAFHHNDDSHIVRYYVIIRQGEVINPVIQVEQSESDFYYVGSLFVADSIAFVFNNYSSPAGNSVYYFIFPNLKKILTVSLKETETLISNSLNILNNQIHCVDFKTGCGVLTKRDLSTVQWQSNSIKTKIIPIFKLPIP